jgi:hypothetical protein
MKKPANTIHAQVVQSLENCRSQVKRLLEVGQKLVPDSVERNAAAACDYFGQGLPGPAHFHLKQLDAQLRRELEDRNAA